MDARAVQQTESLSYVICFIHLLLPVILREVPFGRSVVFVASYACTPSNSTWGMPPVVRSAAPDQKS